MASTDKEIIEKILNLATAEVIVKKELEKKLLSGKTLNIKYGIDPTGKDLHFGHMVAIKKLKEFQSLGHKIFLLFGDFTGQIGDPTGKDKARSLKTKEELESNAKKYLEDIKKFIDLSKVEVVWNAKWLEKLTLKEIISLASNFTTSQMLERDMFQERIKKDLPISIHEFFYPLMQGYDSVALKADVEIGGTDQTFNILAGRVIQKAYNQIPQDMITVPILVGTDGKIKMGKSEGNYIGINESPSEMFGKVMSIPDESILQYFELVTNTEKTEIEKIKSTIKEGENPRNIKLQLAKSIVEIYHDKSKALKAEEEFIKIFSKKEIPTEIETKYIAKTKESVVVLMLQVGFASSKSEARRLIEGNGVKINNELIKEDKEITLTNETILQVGKRRFIKIISKK